MTIRKYVLSSIRVKFSLAVAILLILLNTVNVIYIMHSEGTMIRNREELKAKSIALSLSMAGAKVVTDNLFLIQESLPQFNRFSDVSEILFVDETNMVAASKNISRIGESMSSDSFFQRALKEKKESLEYYRNKQGDEMLVLFEPMLLDGTIHGWIRLDLSLKETGDMIKERTVQLIGLAVLLAVLFTAFGTILTFRFSHALVSGLNTLIDQSKRMADGDFSQRLEIQADDQLGEVGIVARAFSQMSIALKAIINRIQDTSRQVNSVADQMSGRFNQIGEGAVQQSNEVELTSSSIKKANGAIKNIAENIDSLSSSSLSTSSSLAEMSAAINQVAESTVTLSTFVENTVSSLLQMSTSLRQVTGSVHTLSASAAETSSSINEMNVSINEVGKRAKESADLTEKVSQDASELGVGAIEKIYGGMEKIRQTVDQSSRVIIKLEERTEQIGKILTVINEVNRQTNLLALNSAILAAQAGERGRGFVVVSDEIKDLADRTAISTKEIAQLIRDVQSEVKDAVISIKEGEKSVEDGIILTVNAKKSLNNILDRSKRSSDMSHQIEQATFSQIQATLHMIHMIDKINAMVQEVGGTMKEIEKGTQQITEASEHIRVISRQLKTATEEQAKGSKLINEAGGNMAERIQEISRAINEQKEGNETIAKSIHKIHEVARLSVEMVEQMNKAVQGLVSHANLLDEEVNRFKI